jgi:hypothetical protein
MPSSSHVSQFKMCSVQLAGFMNIDHEIPVIRAACQKFGIGALLLDGKLLLHCAHNSPPADRPTDRPRMADWAKIEH